MNCYTIARLIPVPPSRKRSQSVPEVGEFVVGSERFGEQSLWLIGNLL